VEAAPEEEAVEEDVDAEAPLLPQPPPQMRPPGHCTIAGLMDTPTILPIAVIIARIKKPTTKSKQQ